jgi:hypothetical protein
MFTLAGFTVPAQGNPNASWQVTYFVEPLGHYFTALCEQAKAVQVDD